MMLQSERATRIPESTQVVTNPNRKTNATWYHLAAPTFRDWYPHSTLVEPEKACAALWRGTCRASPDTLPFEANNDPSAHLAAVRQT
jgi:hypothetical protein